MSPPQPRIPRPPACALPLSGPGRPRSPDTRIARASAARHPSAATAVSGRPLGRRTEPAWPATAGGRRIDLDAYALAEPDLIAAYACDLIDHLNTAPRPSCRGSPRTAGRSRRRPPPRCPPTRRHSGKQSRARSAWSFAASWWSPPG